MKASEFIQTYAGRGPAAWEAAALEAYRAGAVPDNPWIPLTITSTDGTRTAEIAVTADYLTVGEDGDALRLPMTPKTAQEIANLSGALLPTPWLVYQIWRASTKLQRHPMVPNKGMDLGQFAEHSAIVDHQVSEANAVVRAGRVRPLSGHKKDIVVSRIMKPGKVVIFGWYAPEPDVFTEQKPMTDPTRQPQQPLSNVHGAEYADYSHGVRLVHPIARVDGQEIPTETLYTDPSLASLVSHEGPLTTIRYPSASSPAKPGGAFPIFDVATSPVPPGGGVRKGYAQIGLELWSEMALARFRRAS